MSASQHWAECAAYLEAHCQDGYGVYPDGAMRYAMLLWVLCEAIEVKTVVEIGIGPTSMSGVTFIHSMGSRGGGQLLSIDIDRERPRETYLDLAIEKGVQWRRKYCDSLTAVIPADIVPDLVYVDGDHDFEHALSDSKLLLSILRPGGYFVIDDYPGNVGVVEAAQTLAGQGYHFLHVPHDPPKKQSNGRLIYQKR